MLIIGAAETLTYPCDSCQNVSHHLRTSSLSLLPVNFTLLAYFKFFIAASDCSQCGATQGSCITVRQKS